MVFPNFDRERHEIDDLRRKAADLAQDSLGILDRAFITPLDREGILALITGMNSVIEEIAELSERLALYPLEGLYPNLGKQCSNLLELAIQVEGIMAGLRKKTTLSELAEAASRNCAPRKTKSHLQLISAGAYSLGHGTNDAQKTMGIIAALLVATGKKEWTVGHFHFLGAKHELAMWIILSCHAAMAIGTLFGGWRIVKTMGSRITPHLRPIGGFSAEFAAATTIGLATLASVPGFRPRMPSAAPFPVWAPLEVGTPFDGSGAKKLWSPGS